VNPEHLLAIEFRLPPDDLASRFGRTVQPILDRIALNRQEMAKLAEIRDGLLPRLLSGELWSVGKPLP